MGVSVLFTSSSSQQWFRWFSKLGGAGIFCWFLSGYPVASIPMYLTLAGSVGFGVTRCCHEEVEVGPHCYKSVPAEIETAIPALAQETAALMKNFAADPWKYF